MGKNTSISLTERHQEYLRAKVESGEFASASEVIREALRRAEEQDAKVMRLRQLVRDAEQSGPAAPFDWDAFMERRFPNA